MILRVCLYVLLVTITAAVHAQSPIPVLRIETGMHSAWARRTATDKNGRLIITCADDKTARLWDAATGRPLGVLRIPLGDSAKGNISSCTIDPDGKLAVVGAYTNNANRDSCKVYIFNIQTLEIQHILDLLPGRIRDLEFSPDGKFLAAGIGGEAGVCIYNSSNWSLYKKLEGYAGSVPSLAFDRNGRLATASYDGKIRQYDSKFILLSEESRLSGSQPLHISFNPAGTVLAVGYYDVHHIELREAGSLRLLSLPNTDNLNATIGNVTFSADGKYLFGGLMADHLIDTAANRWIKIIRRWDDQGKGGYTDIRLIPKNIILDLKPLPNNNLFVLGNYPEIVMLDPEGKEIWRNESGNNDLYAGHNVDHLKVSHGGSAIGFTPQYLEPMSFDVSERQLKTEKAIYPSAIDSMKGIKITNWIDGGLPVWNGDTLKFITRCRGVDFSSNGTEVVFGTENALFKLDNKGKVIWSVLPPTGLWTVNISGNDKTIVTTLSDGSIRWFRMEDGKEILTFYLHADRKRWVLFTPSGYYDASPGAEDFLGWHVNNGVDKTPAFYPVSRYRDQFYRPDVIDAILETYNESEALKLANKRSGKKDDSPDAINIVKNSPPVVIIHSPSNGSVASKNKLSITYSVSAPEDAPTLRVKILVNGRPVSLERNIKSSDSGFQKIDVSIPEEDCTITLLAENEHGTSPESNLFIKWNPVNNSKKEIPVKSNLYVLSIGVSNYDQERYRLTFAAKDAEDFSSAVLNQKAKLYDEVFIRKFTDKNATKINILNGLQWIQEKTTKNDVAMIFFAGHGINDNNGIYYMLPVEADIKYLRATCINFEEIKQTQSTIEGKVIVFVDACHSGNILGGTGNYINGLINLLTSTVKGAGAITLTSSTGKETSLENPSWNNGAFTKALIEGMNGAASLGDEKEITYTSLALYISRQVKKLTGDKQHPTLVPTPNTPDFSIALAK